MLIYPSSKIIIIPLNIFPIKLLPVRFSLICQAVLATMSINGLLRMILKVEYADLPIEDHVIKCEHTPRFT